MDKPKYDVTSVFLRLVHFVENDNVYTLTKTKKRAFGEKHLVIYRTFHTSHCPNTANYTCMLKRKMHNVFVTLEYTTDQHDYDVKKNFNLVICDLHAVKTQ